MLREASWIVATFIFLTSALAGVCARHINKKDHNKHRKHHYNKPIIREKSVPREYKEPGEYIVDTW